MRIAYVCSSLSLGGLELNHLKNALWMQQRGHEVFVYAPENSPLFQKATQLGLKTLPMRRQPKYYAWFSALILAKALRRQRITHLFFRDNRDMSMVASIKAIMRNAITTAYFMEMQLGVRKRGILHSIRFSFLDFWFCPLPYLYEQVSTWTKIASHKVKLLPSGIDMNNISSLSKEDARTNLQLPLNAFLIGLIGRFDAQKGQLLALKALSQIENKSIHLVLLGEPTKNERNDVLENIKRVMKENGLEKQVILRPFMDDVTVFYSAMDALIMATNSETFGMVTLEAIAHKVPVIGSNSGGTPDLLNHGAFGLLFEPMNEIDLAQKINQLYANPICFDEPAWKVYMDQFNSETVCKSIEGVVT
jgi:glycosyltransferase involved in cell wall biosynthesis